MKAVIIENDYSVPGEITGFIKDNPIFTEINEQLFCQHRKLEDIGRFLPDAEAIIVMSTFMYKDQLEEFVEALASGKLGKKKYYIFHFLRSLYDWFINNDDKYYFDKFGVFKQNLIKICTEQEVYEVTEDYDNKTKDNFWLGCSSMLSDSEEIRERPKWIPKRIFYDEKLNMFYHEGESAQETLDYYNR